MTDTSHKICIKGLVEIRLAHFIGITICIKDCIMYRTDKWSFERRSDEGESNVKRYEWVGTNKEQWIKGMCFYYLLWE